MIRPGIRRLLAFVARTRGGRVREVDDEIRAHLELRTEQLMRGGLTRDQARAIAAQRFGPFDESRHQMMDAATAREQRMTWNDRIESVQQDVAFALRQLRRAPGFALTTVVTLALGIGANATMFGVVDRLLLQPPAQVADPARVVTASVEVGTTNKHVQTRLSYPIYRDIRNADDAFIEVGAFDNASLTIGQGQTATAIPALKVTASYFRALGVRPALGRFFTDDESERVPGAHVIVLSYWYWQHQLAGAPSILGRVLTVGSESYTVIGIAPPGFAGLELGDVFAWVPFTVGSPPAFPDWQTNRQWYTLTVVARLRPTIGVAAAAAAGTASLQSGERVEGMSTEEIRQRNEHLQLISVLPREARGARPEGRVAALVAGVSLLVLIIACANVANLQLARSMTRRREVAIRVALGVSRGRLLRQLTLDSLLLSLLGGGAALLIVAWGGGFVRRLLVSGGSTAVSPVNWRVLMFTAVAAVITGLVTGLMPALQSMRTELSNTLRAGGRGSHGGSSRARFALIAVQSALTIVLLVGTVLFAQSLERIESVPLGMEPSHVLQVRINVGGVTYPAAQLARDYERLELAAQSSPDVVAGAMSSSFPFGAVTSVEVTLPGRDSASASRGPYYKAVGADFFRTLETQVVAGRSFTRGDRAGSSPVAIVTQTTAKLWWPGENPVGKCVMIGGDTMPCSEVVGVVADTHLRSVVEDPTPMIYSPLGQGGRWATAGALLLRTRRPAADVAKSVTAELRAAAPGVPLTTARPLNDSIDPQMRSWKLGATMFGLFAGLAIVLAAVGLYGVMAYDVAAHTTEIGVRMALGARGVDIRRLIVWRGLRVVALGGSIGVLIALATGARVASLLFKTSPYEPVAFGVAIVVLSAVALFATAGPALRAAGVDPNESLRAS